MKIDVEKVEVRYGKMMIMVDLDSIVEFTNSMYEGNMVVTNTERFTKNLEDVLMKGDAMTDAIEDAVAITLNRMDNGMGYVERDGDE